MTEAPLLLASARARTALGAIALVLLLLLASTQIALVAQSDNLRRQLDRSYGRELALERLLSLQQDIETGQRGFTITGNPAFLQPYLRARSQIGAAFAAIRSNPGNVDVASLEKLSALKIRITEQVIATRQRTGRDAAAAQVATGRGKAAMDSFRFQVTTARQAETRNREALVSSFASSNRRSQLGTALIESLLLALLGAALFAYLANLRRLRAAIAAADDFSSRQAAIFDAATDAMLLVDTGGCVENMNPAAERLFGLAKVDLLGKSMGDLFEEVVYIEGFNERRASTRARDPIRNLTGIRGDGSRFEAEIAQSTVHLADTVRTLLLVRDATERNRLERIKNEFVSTVSHELRTPLTSIRGALALLDHSTGAALEQKPRQLLSIAKSNSERLSLLVDDILDIEKIQSGRFDLALGPLDVRDVLQRAREETQTYATDRGVRIETAMTKEPLIVMGDANRLIQVLTNLISNAAKFSSANGAVMLVAERRGDMALVGVADQGPGIPVEFRSQMFDRFSQAHNQSGVRTGTGLGLAISKAIVDLHKGNIDYETSLGEGTTFWVALPLAREDVH